MTDEKIVGKKVLNGLFWKFGERVIAQLITFGVSIVLARLLLPEEYAIIAIVMIFINLANTLVVNGLGTSLVQKKDSDSLDFSTMFWTSLIFSIVLYCFLFFLSPWISDIYKNEQLTIILRVMSLRIPICAFNSIQQAYVQKYMIFKKFFFSTLIGTLISAVVGIFLAVKGFGVWALVCQYLVNSVVGTMVLFVTIHWHPQFRFSIKRFKDLFSFGSRIMAAGFIGSLFNELKGIIIGLKYSGADLAFYNRGNQIPTLLTTNIESSIESVIFPVLSKIQDEKKNFKETIRLMMEVSAFIMFPILFGLILVAKPLIIILITEKWVRAIPYVQIISFGLIPSIINTINMQAIKASGRGDYYLKLEFVKKPIFLLLILVSMQFGPLYIVFANSVYAYIALLINSFPNRIIINYRLSEQVKDIIPYLIMSVIMFILSFPIQFLPINLYVILLLEIITGIAVYMGVSFLIKPRAYLYVVGYLSKLFKRRKKNDGYNS